MVADFLCPHSGGMGLTGGLVDAGNLFDCLYGIATGQLDDSILDKYSEIRIQKYNDIINPISSSNIRRVWDPSPETIKADPFFQAVERAKKDEEFAEEMKKVGTSSKTRHLMRVLSTRSAPDDSLCRTDKFTGLAHRDA
jgi:hypothetical protein